MPFTGAKSFRWNLQIQIVAFGLYQILPILYFYSPMSSIMNFSSSALDSVMCLVSRGGWGMNRSAPETI